MKCKIPEISWHNRDPVLSVDIQLATVGLQEPTICRLASGGTDTHVLIWYVNRSADGEGVDLELAADLARHQRAVNTVRWSPNGELLASGDDDSVVFIWKQKAEHEVLSIVDADGQSGHDKEVWIAQKVLRGHREDIYDLSWAPNSQFLVTGSVDNTAMLWDVHKGKSMNILDDHKGYVQGVAWDPCNQFIATMSTDRHLRIFDANTKKVLHRVSKATLPVKEDHELYGKSVRLFHDGTLQTFFRRLCFTPDGKLLLTPSGITDYDGVVKPINTTYGFSRYNLSQPSFVLPFPNEYTVAVRCSPVLYSLRPYNAEKNPPMIKLPYRIIYAVATKSSVFFYDTQQAVPFAIVSNIHYTRLTDVTWSSDGNVLVVSSTDGFCSLLTFEASELGERYEGMDTVLSAVAQLSENAPQTNKKSKKQKTRKPSSDEIGVRRPLHEKQKSNTVEIITSSSTNPTIQKSDKPTPIAIRHSPRKVTPMIGKTTECAESTSAVTCNKGPTPIAIKRKANLEAESLQGKPKQPANLLPISLPLPVEIVMSKEIISSEEKFESPEKKCRPVTPIQVRRQPRTPGSSSNNTHTPKSQSAKHATPIAVRRTPRVLIETPMPVNSPVVVEEAMDAWPLEDGVTPIPTTLKLKTPVKEIPNVSTPPPELTLNEISSDRTEDIRLVYEDTQDDESAVVEAAKPTTPKHQTRTPRRVSLRTISTPKSKKKLLE
ncbi:chromatin assembly factor 1 subunit B [Scaptodrosophila lebanonensis]|uniref:Chromatin assembly factor 1 subunit B n=1 Tax=Drosophila lebanonensis TaxID=7225 RepID=A0A6J2TQS2_DROLE|nr:chromatin assembly factor 1 subunit B [Scaptodrosophila lebanonensis]